MKKVVRTIAAVALMFVAATGSAKDTKLNITANAEKSVTIEMDMQSAKQYLSIVDKDGVTFYTENIENANAYSKKFDLQNLPDGNYFLKVENDLKETVFAISISESKISIINRKENVKPIFRKDGKKVYLNLLNLEKKDVRITIFDSDSRIVFNETVTDTALIEKAFNFEKAFEDRYTVVVKNNEDTFYEDIAIK